PDNMRRDNGVLLPQLDHLALLLTVPPKGHGLRFSYRLPTLFVKPNLSGLYSSSLCGDRVNPALHCQFRYRYPTAAFGPGSFVIGGAVGRMSQMFAHRAPERACAHPVYDADGRVVTQYGLVKERFEARQGLMNSQP